MISPLGQRQVLQTVAVEAVRLAMEGGAVVQREQARKQAFDAKLAEAMLDVADVAETDALKLSNQGTQADQEDRREHGTGASEALPTSEEEEIQAEGAGPHLDLLA